MALRGRFRAWAALKTALLAIDGNGGGAGGYWFDLDGRVFEREVLPEDAEGIAFPWVCIPIVDQTPEYEDLEERGMIVRWRQRILYFVQANSNDLVATAAADLLKLHDDIIRAVMADWKLGGTVSTCRFVPGGTEDGPSVTDDDEGRGELVLEMETHFARADLGPNAS